MKIDKTSLQEMESQAINSVLTAMRLFSQIAKESAEQAEEKEVKEFYWGKATLWDHLLRRFPQIVGEEARSIQQEFANLDTELMN